MDKERSSALQELSNMQLKISYLFLELMKEKNEHKQNSENLNKKVEQLSDETENLKKENTELRQSNEDMKCIIDKGVTVFESLDFSNIPKEYKIPLDALKKTFFQFSEKMSEKIPDNLEKGRKYVYVNNTRCKLNYDEIQKEFEGLSDLNFFTNFSYNEADDNLSKKDYVVGRSRSGKVLKSLFQNNSETLKILKEPSPECENESFDSKSVNTVVDGKICRLSPPLCKVETCANRSPVFKDFNVRRQDSISNDENISSSSTSSSSSSLKLFNEKFLEESDDLIISPWKKSRQSNEKTTSKKSPGPKRPRKRLKINSPERSPVNLLKNSNMREAEISFLGVRKLRQTLLNVDCFKKNSENRENENCRNCVDSSKKENKILVDEEDDDFITESPKKGDQILEDVNTKKSEHDLKIPFITPPQNSDTDLDETYISSSLVRKSYATSKRELEKAVQNQTPLKREKSPEYCSVSFVYKREPVRKKVERMKLPGHACIECMKYYENALGNINPQDLKKILNKCSRHRDKNSPTLDDTPPGYWKPYLTCSTIISPNKDDVHKAVIN